MSARLLRGRNRVVSMRAWRIGHLSGNVIYCWEAGNFEIRIGPELNITDTNTKTGNQLLCQDNLVTINRLFPFKPIVSLAMPRVFAQEPLQHTLRLHLADGSAPR